MRGGGLRLAVAGVRETRMYRWVLGALVTVLSLTGAASSGGGVVGAAQDASTPSLDLSSDSQSPGNVALITMSLRVPEGVGIGKVVSEMTFPASVLALEEARRGLSA